MGRVWDTDLPGNLKFVLLAYADAAEHDGTEIWPGRKRVAAMCGISVPTADRLTRKLIEEGFLIQVQKGHRGQRAAYLIPLDRVGNAYQDDTQSIATVQDDSLSTQTKSLSTGAGKPIAADTPPVLDPSSSPVLKDAPPEKVDRPRNLYWDALVELFGHPSSQQERLYGRFVAMVAFGGWEPSEILRRAAYMIDEWGADKVTAASLEKHWSRSDGSVGNVTDEDVALAKAFDKRVATVDRLSE